MKRVILYILFLLFSLNLAAQVVYPIRSYTILQPPLPYNLNGFVSEPGKINLNIIVDDVDLDQYAVKFRLHIEGNGIKLTTRPDFFQQPYYLEGAGTHTLTGFDLEDLLNPDNLIFEGYSRNQYKKTGRLPEGVYRIWVDLYDYYRNVKVSMSSPGIAMIFLAKAPRLSFPLNQTEIDSDLMQNIRFSWFSILPADPLADVRYRFKLFEIRPDGRDPYEITRVMQPVYQEETSQSSFVYDAGMPPLISGMSYAWKVEAYDLENRVLFQNDGHSDVLSFRYGKSCVIPELSINEVKSKTVSLSWITDVVATEYTLAYKRTKDETWQEEKTDLLKYTLNNLDDNSGYQIKIKARCADSETGFSRIQELKTTREVNYACGNKSDKFDLSNTEPLPSLGRFDEFKAADFLVEVEEVSGGNGNFTGKGYALIPYLGFLKFRVEFENIFVNSDSRMTSGEIKFVYDKTTGMIVGETPYGEDENDTVNVKDELDEISDKVIESDTDVSSVEVVGDNVVITYTDGTIENIAVGDNKVISVIGGDGDSGNAYVVDADSGQVFTTPKKVAGGGQGSSSVGTASQTGEYGCTVSFLKATTQRYGFDQVGDGRNKPDSYFLKSKTGDLIAWKSIESGSTDFVNINVSGTCSVDSLRYLRESGLLTPSAPNKKGRQLLLTGLSEGEEDILSVAVAKTKMGSDSSSREILTLAGALGLVTYDRITRNVVLVPVNGAQCPDNIGLLSKELNEIYGPAVVSWNVSVVDSLKVAGIKGKVFEHSGTDKLSKYTSDMRKVINEFKRERDHDRHTLYLFFISENTATKTGFMPLASEYGFIFNFRTDTHVLAHELGHSKDFNLRHTFSEKAQHYFPERSTQNLMDYAGGSELWKYQWDLLHNPEKIFFAWAQDESEGAYGYTVADEMLVLTHLEKFRYGYMFGKEIEVSINVVLEDNFYARDIILGDGKSYKFLKIWQDDFPGKVNFTPEKKDVKSTWSLSISDGMVDVVSYMYGGYQDRNFQLACHEDNATQFASYIFPDKSNTSLYKQQFNKVITDHFINAERSDVIDNLNEFSIGIYKNLTIVNRVGLLAKLADGTMNSGQFNQESTPVDQDYSEEGFALSIIETCPTSESSAFVTELKGKSGLLKALDEGFDDTEYFGADGNQSKFAQSMFNHVLSASQAKVNIDDNSRVYHYVDPLLIQFPVADRSEVNEQGEIELDLRLTATEIGNNNKHAFDEWVLVYFEKDVPEIGYKKGDIKPVPAYFYHYLIRKEINESYRQSISLVIDLASMAIAIGEIKAGVKGIRYAIAVADIAASIPNIVISSFEEEIRRLPGGKDFIHDFRIATALIALVDVGTLPLEGFFKVADGELTRMGKFMETNEDALKAIDSDIAETTSKLIGKTSNVISRTATEFKAFWNTLNGVPKTTSTQYTLWRRVDKSWESAVTHPLQVNNKVNRYSKGREAVYFGTSKEVSDAEWLSYNKQFGLRGPNGSKLCKFEVVESELLDLTKQNILNKLEINIELITDIENKAIPQALGDWAFENGYKGIISPSARMDNGVNIVIFKYFEGNTPPSIIKTEIIEVID